MRRREFIKTQGITLSGLFIFPFVNREKYYYTFDELFTNKIFSNENLFYFKNTPIKNKIKTLSMVVRPMETMSNYSKGATNLVF